MLPQVIEIISEVQRKMSNEKQEENKLSNLQNAFFFWTPPTFKLHKFLISY
jgi:hypothetical protein